MDIKKSFHRFKKNYIRESEALDNEEFVDVDLDGTTKTGIDWVKEYYECGGDDNSWLDIAINYCLKAGLDADSFDTQEQVDEFLAGVSYDELVDVLGTPEEAVKAEEQPGLSDEDYIDPETMLDAGYDEDFNGNESYKRRKGKRLISEASPVINDDLDSFDRQDKYDKFVQDNEVLDTNIDDDCIYGIDVYYNEDGSFPDIGYQQPEETLRYTYDEMVEEFGESCADEIITQGSYDTGNNTYYKLDYIEYANGDRIEASDMEFGIDESCCGGKKKGKKKSKKSKFVPFWAKKKLDEVSLGDGIHEGSGEWNYEDDIVKIDIFSNRCEGDDEEDIYLAEAEVLVEYKDPNYDFTSQREKYYDLAYNALRPDDGMDDSYFDGERTIGKIDFFFKLDDDCEAIVAELTPIAQKVFIGNVQEALKTLRKAGYIIKERINYYDDKD